MQIRLADVPVERKHGLPKGRIFEVIDQEKAERGQKYWVKGDAGENCVLFRREFEIIDSKVRSE